MHVVTSGHAFIDIDAYGSTVALAELLRLQGEDALAADTAPLNSSIPTSLRNLKVQYSTGYKPSPDDVFTIVDLSVPEYFDFNAPVDKVVGVVDHHLDQKDFWDERLGSRSHIEFVGAACTQVYELWQKSGVLDKMSQNSAKLLACGILDNTLNLKAKITTERDQSAYTHLSKHAGLTDDWPEQYFADCQDFTLNDIDKAIGSDSKHLQYPSLSSKTYVGQLVLWDAKEFMQSSKNIIRRILSAEDLPWYMNLIDIRSGKSVFFCEDTDLKSWLADILGVTFEKDLATANRMWLRKEIMKQAIEKGGKL